MAEQNFPKWTKSSEKNVKKKLTKKSTANTSYWISSLMNVCGSGADYRKEGTLPVLLFSELERSKTFSNIIFGLTWNYFFEFKRFRVFMKGQQIGSRVKAHEEVVVADVLGQHVYFYEHLYCK